MKLNRQPQAQREKSNQMMMGKLVIKSVMDNQVREILKAVSLAMDKLGENKQDLELQHRHPILALPTAKAPQMQGKGLVARMKAISSTVTTSKNLWR